MDKNKMSCINKDTKFTIRGRKAGKGENVGKITDWIFHESNDNSAWNDLYKGDRVFIDYEF